jgi:hypothetical protein
MVQKNTRYLQLISQKTESFRRNMGFSTPVEKIPLAIPYGPSPVFELPPIPDIQPQLIKAGASPSLARSLYRNYCDKAVLCHKRSLYHLSTLPGVTNDKWPNYLSETLFKQLESWRDQSAGYIHAKRFRYRMVPQRSHRPFPIVSCIRAAFFCYSYVVRNPPPF